MSRGTYSGGKRQREADKARKKKDKAEKRMQRRDRPPGEVPITTAEDVTGVLPSVEEAMSAIRARANAPRSASAIPVRLYVGGLSWDTTEEGLRNAFAALGKVIEVAIITDRETGSSRGFGFVTMDRKDANRAIEALHNTDLDGRNIVVNIATERQR